MLCAYVHMARSTAAFIVRIVVVLNSDTAALRETFSASAATDIVAHRSDLQSDVSARHAIMHLII